MHKNQDIMLNDGFRQAEIITRRYAKTFYYASWFLTAPKRRAAYCVYAICRLSDECVDRKEPEPGAIETIREKIGLAYSNNDLSSGLLYSFRNVVREYVIPREYFEELLEGMRMDLNIFSYSDFESLSRYCYRVAGVVGLIMLQIFGFQDDSAKKHALELGMAMQLTNILRDIKEDLARGRIYLPQDELVRFGISSDDLRKEKVTPRFQEFMRFQIDRARSYYACAEKGIALINDKHCRFSVRAMAGLYSGILDKIEELDYDIFSSRAHLSGIDKVFRIIRLFSKGA